MDFWRVNFKLFRILVKRVHWDSALKGKSVQGSCTLLKKEVLKVQEQAVPPVP